MVWHGMAWQVLWPYLQKKWDQRSYGWRGLPPFFLLPMFAGGNTRTRKMTQNQLNKLHLGPKFEIAWR